MNSRPPTVDLATTFTFALFIIHVTFCVCVSYNSALGAGFAGLFLPNLHAVVFVMIHRELVVIDSN